jgi:hypothetical protein
MLRALTGSGLYQVLLEGALLLLAQDPAAYPQASRDDVPVFHYLSAANGAAMYLVINAGPRWAGQMEAVVCGDVVVDVAYICVFLICCAVASFVSHRTLLHVCHNQCRPCLFMAGSQEVPGGTGAECWASGVVKYSLYLLSWVPY